MAKVIPDLIHDADKLRVTDHKPKGAKNGPMTVCNGLSQSDYGNQERSYHVNEVVLVKVFHEYKTGCIVSISNQDGMKLYSVRLNASHGGHIVQTDKVYGASVSFINSPN